VQSIPGTIEGISGKRLHVGKPASPLLEIASVLVCFDHGEIEVRHPELVVFVTEYSALLSGLGI
jgi:hypothetical protein